MTPLPDGGLSCSLAPFPGKLHPDIEITVEATRLRPGTLRLWFVIMGSIDDLLIPAPVEQERGDGLWRSTCFEAFVLIGSGNSYLEFNFAPSQQWAAYCFDRYRAGQKDWPTAAPDIMLATIAEHWVLGVDLDLHDLAEFSPWRIGLSAVIEETDGAKSYWALAHPPGEPDFHHPDCFALELPSPVGP